MNADLAEKVMATDSSSDRPARVDRVWSVQDLQILHEIQKPIAVIVPEGNKLSRTRSAGLQAIAMLSSLRFLSFSHPRHTLAARKTSALVCSFTTQNASDDLAPLGPCWTVRMS